MSEIAEDMADGTTCSICGLYFQDPDDPAKAYTHGYPVACKLCFRAGMRREGIQKARVKTI
jgi:hypothetical protein